MITGTLTEKSLYQTMDWCDKIHDIKQMSSERIHLDQTTVDEETGYNTT